MPTHRNDPCPCGSGLKYKKCCLNPRTDDVPQNFSPLAISSLIAYAGAIGRKRKEWCARYIEWQKALLHEFASYQSSQAIAIGKPISCSKGCSHCCSQHVVATLQEGEGIAYWLSQHPAIRDAFLSRYKIWRAALRQHESTFQQVAESGLKSFSHPKDTSLMATFLQKADEYRKLNIPCPFLDQGQCSIYEVRPTVCASLAVVSPPDHCHVSSTALPSVIRMPHGPIPPPYFYGEQQSIIYSPAALLVYEILFAGFMYLADLLNAPDLEHAAFADPEVRALLKANNL